MLFDTQTTENLEPIIKWAGGKEKELKYIIPNAPASFNHYYEPFVGGGSVFAAFEAKKFFINDKSDELIGLYTCIKSKDKGFFQWVDLIISSWSNMLRYVAHHTELQTLYKSYRQEDIDSDTVKAKLTKHLADNKKELSSVISQAFKWHRDTYEKELKVNLVRKVLRMYKLEKEKGIMPDRDVHDNIETAFMSALYMYYRCLYNDAGLKGSDPGLSTALFLFIRNYSYSGMFRYNDKGDFNVPYGGIAYNTKSLQKKIDYYKSDALSEHFKKTKIDNLDFEEFFRLNPPKKDDFVFLDPPYDSDFSTYAQNEFTREDQKRLADYLCNECKGKWMMVIKYTPFIYSLYENKGLTISTFDKQYLVSFMNRNDKNAEHLIIMNY